MPVQAPDFAAPARIPNGTLVGVEKVPGLCRISAPGEWGGPEMESVTRYNLQAPDGSCLMGILAKRITPLPQALQLVC